MCCPLSTDFGVHSVALHTASTILQIALLMMRSENRDLANGSIVYTGSSTPLRMNEPWKMFLANMFICVMAALIPQLLKWSQWKIRRCALIFIYTFIWRRETRKRKVGRGNLGLERRWEKSSCFVDKGDILFRDMVSIILLRLLLVNLLKHEVIDHLTLSIPFITGERRYGWTLKRRTGSKEFIVRHGAWKRSVSHVIRAGRGNTMARIQAWWRLWREILLHVRSIRRKIGSVVWMPSLLGAWGASLLLGLVLSEVLFKRRLIVATLQNRKHPFLLSAGRHRRNLAHDGLLLEMEFGEKRWHEFYD